MNGIAKYGKFGHNTAREAEFRSFDGGVSLEFNSTYDELYVI